MLKIINKLIDGTTEHTSKVRHSPRFIDALKESGFPSSSHVASHILLFTSALVPKAMSSLLCSFFLSTEDQVNKGPTQVLYFT